MRSIRWLVAVAFAFTLFACQSSVGGPPLHPGGDSAKPGGADGGFGDTQPVGDTREPGDTTTTSPATAVAYPDASGVIDVTAAPYNADNSGQSDATAAIQAALEAYPNGNRIIFLPAGEYRVCGTLTWPAGDGGNTHKRTTLEGAGRARTVIRLQDQCPGFADPQNRKAVIWTGPSPAQRFRNSIRHLTVDTGKGNPGACGIQYNTSNQGHILSVTIRSGDGAGVAGLDMAFTDEIGPCLIRDLEVEGFDRGVWTAGVVNSQTIEHLTLRDQNEVGVLNAQQVLTIRGLFSDNAVTAVKNASPAVTTLLDAELQGGDSKNPAIENTAMLFTRNVAVAGYGSAIADDVGAGAVGPVVAEYASHAPLSLFTPTSLSSLGLPVKEPPTVPWDPPSSWVSPMAFGAVGDGVADDSAALQAAIDSGATTVFLDGGAVFNTSGTIVVRGALRRLVGLEGRLSGSGVLRVQDGDSPVVVIERPNGIYSTVSVVHASSRTLVLRSMTGFGYRNEPGAGELFLDDFCSGDLTFDHQTVWARQLNLENASTKLQNIGGTVWILGLKTEREGTLVETSAGGKTEVLGCFTYATSAAKTMPTYRVTDAALSVAGHGGACFNGNPWQVLVEETRAGVTQSLLRADAPGRANDSAFSLFLGY